MKTKFPVDDEDPTSSSQLEGKPKGSAHHTLGDLASGHDDQQEKWYSSLPPEPTEFSPCPDDVLNQLMQEAKTMLDSDSNGYNIKSKKNSEKKWMHTVMTKGTAKDKIAAYTLMVQEKSIYNLQAIRTLISLVKPAKKESAGAINTIVELFVSDLLPPDRKLKYFSQHPLVMLDELCSGNPGGRRRRLTAWYFEDQLKHIFKDFLDSLRLVAAEAIDATKEKAIMGMAMLLESHPEQEAVLLTNLINKLGDPTKAIAVKALSGLSKVLQKHPNMKKVVIMEVEKFLFRSNISKKARYYGVCFLSQLTFLRSDTQLAADVIKIYFSFFKACVKTGEVDSKLLAILLTGVNRAYPYARDAMNTVIDQMETLYKLVHIAPLKSSLPALTLLFQVSDYKSNVSDRFYQALYQKLLDPELAVTSHAPMFLNLTFQALKKDESIPRKRVFIKRLLEVLHKQPALSPDSFLSEIKVEKNEQIKNEAFLNDDSGDENYEDVPLDEDGSSKNESAKTGMKSCASWLHKPQEKKKSTREGYDPMHRNPLYAGGEFCTYAELCYLSKHFHPTIALFARNILESALISYQGDPLQDFTLIRFLERFSFKNPKKQPEVPSQSLFSKRKNYSVSGARSLPIKEMLSNEESKVPVDELYLFRYLQQKRIIEEENKAEEDDDNESVGSDEFNDILDDLLKKRGIKSDMDDDLEPDFANDYNQTKSSKKNSRKGNEDDDMSGSDEADIQDDENHEGDEEMPSDEDLDFDNLDDDDEDIDFGSDTDDESTADRQSKNKKAHKKTSKKSQDLKGVFANAEEFAELLEATSSAREGTLGALANQDNASLKQLNWEENRDRWVKGFTGKKFKKGPKMSGGPKKGKISGSGRKMSGVMKKGKLSRTKKPSFKAKGKKRF